MNLLRGIADITPKRPLADKVLNVKAGFDPTTPDLHLGHLVLLKKMKDFQDEGHNITIVVGDFTAMIGDPTGKNQTRPQLSVEQVKKNADIYTEQVLKILDRDRTKIVFNSTWWDKKSAADMIKLSSSITVARMLDREDFKNRFTGHLPISLHEFLYPLLQGYDSVELKSDIELGGTDQTFNLHMGRMLQEMEGQTPQQCITMPILLGTDGVQKMSKSIGNTINLNDNSYFITQKILNMPDSNIDSYFELLTSVEYNFYSPLSNKEAKELLANEINKLLGNNDIDTLILKANNSLPVGAVINQLNLAKNSNAAREMVTRNVVFVDGVLATIETRINLNQTVSLKVGKKEPINVRLELKDE